MSITLLIIVVFLIIFCILFFIAAYQKATNAICISKKRLDGMTAIVTGGTAGMGLEIAKDFAFRGAKVIIACPFEIEGLNAKKKIIEETENENIVFKLLDLGSLKSTRDFAENIVKNEDRLDILVNNAGTGRPPKMSVDGLNFIMQVNYFGAYLLTILLLPLLRKTGKSGEPSRIINTGSLGHNFGRVEIEYLNSYERYYFTLLTYSNSKLCLLLFTYELAKRLENSEVVVNAIDPGLVGTKLWLHLNKFTGLIISWACFLMFKTPWQGAQTAIHAAVDKKAGKVSGKYFQNCKIINPKRQATDEKLAKKLWEESARLVKLADEEIDHCFKL